MHSEHTGGAFVVACNGSVLDMPVMVTGAESAEGRATATWLRRSGGEVRVFVARAAAEEAEVLRSAGCKVARGDLDDEGHLETALEQVHTVVHLAGGPMTDPDAVLDDAATVLSAAMGAGCRRMMWASHLGADAPRGNAYLEACAETEALLDDAPLETIVVRRALTYGVGDVLTEALAAGALPPEAAESTHSPLYAGDLAMVLAEADRVRGGVGDLSLTLALAGPTEVLAGAFADLLAAPDRDPRRAPGLPFHVVDLLARDLVDDKALVGPTDIPEGLQLLADD